MKKLLTLSVCLLAFAVANASDLPSFKFVGLYDGQNTPKLGLSYDLAPITKDKRFWLTGVTATSANGGENLWQGAAITCRLSTNTGLKFDVMLGATANLFRQSPGEAAARFFVGLAIGYDGLRF